MKITPIYFSEMPALLGRRMVDLSGIDDLQGQVAGFVKATEEVRHHTLINLAGEIESDLVNFIRLARAKGRRLLRIVQVGSQAVFPEWLQAVDVVLINVTAPATLENAPAFNEAIQELWFARQDLRVACHVRTDADAPMVEMLHSYTPNDVPFYIQLAQGCTTIQRQWLMREFGHDRFGTARIVQLEGYQQ